MRHIFFSAVLFLSLLESAPRCVAKADELPELWHLSPGEHVDSTPAIDQQGNIYVTVSGNHGYLDISGGKLVSANADGAERWMFKIRCDTKSSPALGDDGTVYFGARDRNLYAVSSEGKLRWAFSTGAWVDASPAIATNGVIYIGSWDRKFYAVNPDGGKRWEFATEGPIDSSAAIAPDGTIYFGSHDKRFYAVNPDGSRKWDFATEGAILSSPALNCDGTIYFTSVDGKFYALNPDGTKKWETWTGGVRESSPVIDAEGNLYVGVNDTFQAFKPDGTKTWFFGYPVVQGSAAIAADGMIYYCGTGEGTGILYGFAPDGTLKSYTNLNGYNSASPAIGSDGRIYAGSYALHAYKGTAALAKSCWPEFRGGPRQNGRAGQ